ncbi:hypothetical protein [Actinorugispora endophytica]|uniref:DUF3558 domain-containing protein n=1 Tax=Actinorugispora endophytica TaxID=1605990 RepID=A0A4R6V3K1_9ACTN|nr:hypothetical protein [Actinorugispora endophytica]TDQ50734.1 hypothetical protein EV190_11239 [Actinorugispora endophytica]
MRLVPSSPLSWFAATAGAVLAAGVLFVGCGALPLDGASEGPADAEASPTPAPSPTPEAARFALPASCAEVGADELVGGLAPEGAAVAEEAGEIEGVTDAARLSCAWHDSAAAGAGASFALVFTVNADPSDKAPVVRMPGGQEEMNWEVDVDVDVDTYRTDQADELGGELKSVTTVEGSSRQLHLSLPGDFHVSAVAMFSDASREDMEHVLVSAALRTRR